MVRTLLVLGGTGAIGDACARRFEHDDWDVLRSSSRPGVPDTVHVGGPADLQALDTLPVLDAVVWAQGTNRNDSILDFDWEAFDALQQANTTFVAMTLHRLLDNGRVASGARLVVVSSVWQQIARTTKLSYAVSKAALGGLVRSVAVDLAPCQISINAVLPGVVDTPMTRSMLTEDQIRAVQLATGAGRLVQLDELAEVVHFLGATNTAMTGQSLAVDLGFSIARQL